MADMKYSKTVFDPTGNPRSGLTVMMSGSAGELVMLEDPLRTGLYYRSAPQGVYNLYIGGVKDNELSPFWHDTETPDSGSIADMTYLRLDATNDPLTGALSGSSADFSDALTVNTVDVSLSTHDHDADYSYITGSYQITAVGETAVTDHEAALSITEDQIADLDHNATSLTGSALSGVAPISGQALVFNGSVYASVNTGSFGDSDARWIPLGPWQDSMVSGPSDDATSISYTTDNWEEYLSGSAEGIDVYYKARVKYVYDGTHTAIRLRHDSWFTGPGTKFDPETRIYVDGASKNNANITDSAPGTNNNLDWTISGLTPGNAYELQHVWVISVGTGGISDDHEVHHNPKKTMFYVK